jgi:hypothetical protein
MGRACSPLGEKRSAYGVSVAKHEGMISLGKRKVGGRIILNWIFEN